MGTDSHIMHAKINYAIISPTSRKQFLHLSKLKNENKCSQWRKVFRAQGWDESYLECLGPGWVLHPGVSRWINRVLCHYTVFRSTFLVSFFYWITGPWLGLLLSSFAIQSLPFSPAPCIPKHLVSCVWHYVWWVYVSLYLTTNLTIINKQVASQIEN